MATELYTSISSDIADDKKRLLEVAVNHFGSNFEESKVDIEDNWTSYNVRLFEGLPTERLVIFRSPPTSRVLGCIRVRGERGTQKLWEVVQKSGVYIGLIPASCSFEAMLVQVKLIIRKEGSN